MKFSSITYPLPFFMDILDKQLPPPPMPTRSFVGTVSTDYYT